jgi:hypothetical protein
MILTKITDSRLITRLLLTQSSDNTQIPSFPLPSLGTAMLSTADAKGEN